MCGARGQGPPQPGTADKTRIEDTKGGGSAALLFWREDQTMTEKAGPERAILRGLRGRCPRCGEGRLFKGFLGLSDRCDRCELDYDFADAGDGPAVFVILIGGFIVVFAALAVEVAYAPPYWVHAALWIPLVLLVTLGPLRPLKGVLIALQYHHRAAEGRLDRRSDS